MQFEDSLQQEPSQYLVPKIWFINSMNFKNCTKWAPTKTRAQTRAAARNRAQPHTDARNRAQPRTNAHNRAQTRAIAHNRAQTRATAHNRAQTRATAPNRAQTRATLRAVVRVLSASCARSVRGLEPCARYARACARPARVLCAV